MNDVGSSTPSFAGDLIIQALDLNDIATVRRLQIAACRAAPADLVLQAQMDAFSAWAHSPEFAQTLYEATQRKELIGAYHAGQLIGTAEWMNNAPSAETAQIRGLFIDPAFSGLGCGSRLLSETEHQIACSSITQLSARTFPDASGFFEKHGYQVTSQGPLPLPPGNLLQMTYLRKKLQPGT